MNKAELINILLSFADEEIRMVARWLVAQLPPALTDILKNPIARRLLGPVSAWVEARGEHKAPLVRALYEKLSDMLDAAAHELFTRRHERTVVVAEWQREAEAAPQLATALAAHAGGMSAADFLRKVWQALDAAATSFDQWLAPKLKAHADRLEQHPAVQKRLRPKTA
jgi:hypothetical protein